MRAPRRVIIVGGGITGLAAAHALEKPRGPGAETQVTLLEASERLGGTIRTERHGDLILDVGADGWVAGKPQATALAREVGLDDALIETSPANRGLYLGWQGQLARMPEGLVLGVPSRWGPVLASPLFSREGKSRMLLEPYIPAKVWGADDDESIVSFVTRRLGAELATIVGTPLLGGIVSGDVAELSIRATFPQLVDAEVSEGSLVRSARKRAAAAPPREPGVAIPSPFRSLKEGVESLVHAVAASLGQTDIRTNAAVRAIGRDGDAYRVTLASGESLGADAVFVAAPFGVAKALLSPLGASLANALAPLRETRSSAIFLVYKTADVRHPLAATGFLVPKVDDRPIAAVTWLSQKWSGRAPGGTLIVRAFWRAQPGEPGAGELADDEMIARADRDVRAWMQIDGAPSFAKVARWTRPYLEVGHLTRMATLQRALAEHPHLYVGGSGYAGVGIPDAIAQGQATARRILG